MVHFLFMASLKFKPRGPVLSGRGDRLRGKGESSEEAESRRPGIGSWGEGRIGIPKAPSCKEDPLPGTSSATGGWGRTPHLAPTSDQSLILERGPDILCVCMTEVAVRLA